MGDRPVGESIIFTSDDKYNRKNNDVHLWMAVMDRAVRDLLALERHLQNPEIMNDPVFRYDYRTLRKWFRSTSMEPGSFSWICSLVDVDPAWALDRLKERLGCLVDTVPRAKVDIGVAA